MKKIAPMIKANIFVSLLAVSLAPAQQISPLSEQLLEEGVYKYVVNTFEVSNALKSYFSESQKIQLMQQLHPFIDTKTIEVTASGHEVCDSYRVDVAIAKAANSAGVVLLESRDGQRDSAHGVIANTLSNGLAMLCKDYNGVFPNTEINEDLINSTKAAISKTVSEKSIAPFYDFEKALSAKLKNPPGYITERIESHNDADISQKDSFFAITAPFGDVTYICSKLICPSFFYSLYRCDSKSGPMVFAVVYEEVDGKPVICLLAPHAGIPVLSYTQDIRQNTPRKK